jgi:hypothetical protein
MGVTVNQAWHENLAMAVHYFGSFVLAADVILFADGDDRVTSNGYCARKILVEILIHGQNRGILEQLINFFHLLLCLSLVCFEVVKRITAYSSKIQHRRNLAEALS